MDLNGNAILIVDDDPEMRDLMKDILEDHQYAVTVAKEGAEALEILDNNEFYVVLTDLRMKGMVLHALRPIQPDEVDASTVRAQYAAGVSYVDDHGGQVCCAHGWSSGSVASGPGDCNACIRRAISASAPLVDGS